MSKGVKWSDPSDTQSKPCYDAHALMRQYEVIGQLAEAMEKLGWGPYQADHEDGNGQFEINWSSRPRDSGQQQLNCSVVLAPVFLSLGRC